MEFLQEKNQLTVCVWPLMWSDGTQEKKKKFSGPSQSKAVYTHILFSLTWQIVKFLHIDLLHNLHTVTPFNSPMGHWWATYVDISEKLLLVIKSPHWSVCVHGDDGAFLPPVGGIGLLKWLKISFTDRKTQHMCMPYLETQITQRPI